MIPKSNTRLRITGDDLMEINRDLASKLGLTEKPRKPLQTAVEAAPFHGRFEIHYPRPGLHLYVLDLLSEHDIELLVSMKQPTTVVSLVLAGSSRQCVQRLNTGEAVVDFETGKSILCTLHAERSRFHLGGGQRHQIVELHIDPSAIRAWINPDETAASEPIRSLFSQAQGSRVNVKTPLTYRLEDVARQILHCTLQRASRPLFMESKALEILALELDAFSQVRVPETGLSTQELRRLELARHILEQDFDDPPSLLELSRKVGLNDFKLKRGFRQAYSTTVFGYVRRLRMEKARALLETGDFNVTEAAVATGYSCLGHFTAAFKKCFGFLPSDVLRK